MQLLSRIYVRIRDGRGQSMTEYALILAAVAVVAFVVYNNLGNSIGTTLNNIMNDL
jgi:Flp pilus assembly pilin Flp